MTLLRFKALRTVQHRSEMNGNNVGHQRQSEFFGMYVFDKHSMKEYLSKEAYIHVKHAIDSGKKISKEIANDVANGMKNWAIAHGATHYTHWFQPLNGLTAEKHDSFFTLESNGEAMEKFTGSALTQQEPDASSLPSGGIRNTFEARGYTAWDPSSPAFLMKTKSGLTLSIPTIFVSYTGEALDFKAPLLKALHGLEKAVLPVCQIFDKNITKIETTLGVEQEYFLIDAAFYNSRPDLLLTNRTLFGMSPARGQQLEDHYFGSIPERIQAFMVNLENESIKLGIPLRTRHNEVAPGQYECAPQFEDVNLATDHNQLLMDLIQKIAIRHNLRAILHEKPFANINGSGKHCNWSIQTNTGVNLLSPGKTPQSNLQFLTILINVFKAVNDNADLLRASIASAGNDHRLGANEAPPAIISVFLGKELTRVIEFIEKGSNTGKSSKIDKELKINIPKIPEILRDNTDRNRTSPFAFTGNKFEFRAVGSSANVGSPMIALNTIVSDQLTQFKKELDKEVKSGTELNAAILTILRNYIKTSKQILFEGNNYSLEWEKEAEKRGLSNIKSTPEALKSYISKKTIDLFTRNHIFTEKELHARYEIRQDIYNKKLQIESRLMGDLAMNNIIPAAIEYQNSLITNYAGLKNIGLEDETEYILNTIKKISVHIKEIKSNVQLMVAERKRINNIEDTTKRSIAYYDSVIPFMETIRYHIDRLELNTDDKLWPLPKYRELLFLR